MIPDHIHNRPNPKPATAGRHFLAHQLTALPITYVFRSRFSFHASMFQARPGSSCPRMKDSLMGSD